MGACILLTICPASHCHCDQALLWLFTVVVLVCAVCVVMTASSLEGRNKDRNCCRFLGTDISALAEDENETVL